MPERTILSLDGLLQPIRQDSQCQDVLQKLSARGRAASAFTLSWELPEAARPTVLAALRKDWPDLILVITSHPERARTLHEQVSLWAAGGQAGPGLAGAETSSLWYFPAPDALFYDPTPWDGETIRRRIMVLSALASRHYSQPPMILTSVWALMTLTAPPDRLRPGLQQLRVGQTLRIGSLLNDLVGFGYQPVAVVEEPGSFAQRGGILDVFAPNAAQPVRIEWFGNDIESMRTFDPSTQRSAQMLDSLTLYPASEALPLYSELALSCLSRPNDDADALITSRLQRDLERLEAAEYFRGLEFYLPCLYHDAATLLDYLPANALVVMDDRPAIEVAAQNLESQSFDLKAELLESGQITPGFPSPYKSWMVLQQPLAAMTGIHLGHSIQAGHESGQERVISPFHVAPRYGGRIDQLVEDCLQARESGQRTIIISRQAQRLANWFEEAGEVITPSDSLTELPPAGSLVLIPAALAEGWVLGEPAPSRAVLHEPAPLKIVLLTDTEIFGWAKPRRRPYTRTKAASPESFFAKLNEGDYVVHIDHGIGVYRGLVHKTVDNTPREYLELEYAAGDRLFVPVSHMDRITRYVGGTDHTPNVHRLGSAEWKSVRSRAKKAVQNIARQLLKLYAARQVVEGHPFAPDTAWQEELEASFLYDETPDQLLAVADVKEDMEAPQPMDRLLIGDVGYGKTEVAIRAAFKAVMDGKQVAVLVPTTVLAQQHLLTFQQRLAAFPVEVAMLSRFCSPKEQKAVVQRLKAGRADMVIGTHRLLQKDVAFKDLGLLVVDEEHRFGVRHKEWLKQMRQQIDVLTMTATPIPRTLNMALGGVRDMSTIDTPPEERLPIRTQVVPYDEALIRRAILRELNRNGQVYFVHNRVQGIRQIAQRLQKIVPEATIAIGHGQMEEEKLSKVMLGFAGGRYDVLVCTTIIESGLDIPNVNTIIINHADRLGLAQLYQLRGRVGRSTVQAYAYLLHSKHHRLSDVARRRLEAILEASELGAGFGIAMRDLEIRGAGEILGVEQHGHIAAIGFELYTRLLAQAVDEIRDAGADAESLEPEVSTPPLIELPVQAYIPEEYVPDEGLRIKIYQRLATMSSEEELEETRRELEDRFGLLPTAAEDLLYVLRIRMLAEQAGVRAIGREDHNLVLKLDAEAQERARAIASHFGRRAWVGRGQMWLAMRPEEGDWRMVLESLLVRLGGRGGSHA
jgi:transcription-repair coupling factor (superfamily II helicase)